MNTLAFISALFRARVLKRIMQGHCLIMNLDYKSVKVFFFIFKVEKQIFKKMFILIILIIHIGIY